MRLKIHFFLKLFFHFEFYRIIKDPIHLTHEPCLDLNRKSAVSDPTSAVSDRKSADFPPEVSWLLKIRFI